MITSVGILHEPGHAEPWYVAIALHWVVSAGLSHEKVNRDHGEKRGPKNPLDPVSRFLNEVYALCEDAVALIKNQILYGFT